MGTIKLVVYAEKSHDKNGERTFYGVMTLTPMGKNLELEIFNKQISYGIEIDGYKGEYGSEIYYYSIAELALEIFNALKDSNSRESSISFNHCPDHIDFSLYGNKQLKIDSIKRVRPLNKKERDQFMKALVDLL